MLSSLSSRSLSRSQCQTRFTGKRPCLPLSTKRVDCSLWNAGNKCALGATARATAGGAAAGVSACVWMASRRLRGAFKRRGPQVCSGSFRLRVRGLLLISIDRSVPYLVGRLHAISTLGGSENSSNGRRPRNQHKFVTYRDDSSNLVLRGFFHAQRISCAGARDIEKQGQLSIPGAWKFPAWEISLRLGTNGRVGTSAASSV